MSRSILFAVALFPLTACYIEPYPGDGPGNGGGGPYNSAPHITYADAGCWWDGQSRDYVWSFEATANDPDGVYDVVDVYADVYDSADVWQDGFDLWPDDSDPTYWYSDWYEGSTLLYCSYPGYVVDITAVDSYGDYDVVSLYPYAAL
jgi:hypothetical protein